MRCVRTDVQQQLEGVVQGRVGGGRAGLVQELGDAPLARTRHTQRTHLPCNQTKQAASLVRDGREGIEGLSKGVRAGVGEGGAGYLQAEGLERGADDLGQLKGLQLV